MVRHANPQRARPALLLIPLLSLAGCGGDAPVTSLEITEIADVGLRAPWAVEVDPVDDVYLIANAGGPVGERDRNGFITRLSPDGEVLALDWSASGEATDELALHSPTGLAIRGDSLLVADLDCLRILHRTSGQPLARECVLTAEFLSDVAVGPDGSIYVLDSGLAWAGNGTMEETGTDAVYRLVIGEEGRNTTLDRGDELGHPSAVAVGNRGIFVATSGTGEIFRVVPGQPRTTVYPARGIEISGLVFLPDGGFAFSTKAEGAVYRVTGQGRVERILENVPGPGRLGYDAARDRLIVPLVDEDRILFVALS